MKLPVSSLGAVITAWMDKELVPKAVGWQKALTIVAGIGIANNAANIVAQYLPAMQMLGYADCDGFIDIDKLHVAFKAAFEKTGKLQLPGGIILSAADVDSMVSVARAFATGATNE